MNGGCGGGGGGGGGGIEGAIFTVFNAIVIPTTVPVVHVVPLSFFATTETVVSTQRHRGSVPTNVTDFSSTTVKVSRS